MKDEHFAEVQKLNAELLKFNASIGFAMHPMPLNQGEYDELITVAKKAIELKDPDYIDKHYDIDYNSIY